MCCEMPFQYVPQLTLITQNVDDPHERAGEPLPDLEWLATVTAASRCENFFSIGTETYFAEEVSKPIERWVRGLTATPPWQGLIGTRCGKFNSRRCSGGTATSS